MARHLRLSRALGQLLLVALVVNLIFIFPVANPALAAAGDILVADLDAPGPGAGPGRIFRLDPCTGGLKGEYSGSFKEPSGIAIAANGDLLAVDSEAFGGIDSGPGGVIRLESISGTTTAEYKGAQYAFVNPFAIAVAPNGEIWVADLDAGSVPPTDESAVGGVIRLDPSGNQIAAYSTGPGYDFVEPAGIAVAPSGDILVADLDTGGSLGSAAGGVIRLNASGVQTQVHSVPNFVEPSGVAVAPNGEIFVADAEAFGGGGGVFRLSSQGDEIRDYRGGAFVEPTGVALAPNGEILVADQEAFGGIGGIIRVNPATAAQQEYRGGFFLDPAGIAVEPGAIGACPGPDPGPGPGPSPTPLTCQGLQATLSGTSEKETLKGTPVNDVIVGLAGADTIKGLAGHDRICGGSGKDKVSGGAGKDRLYGEAGNDKLLGGTGNDRLVGGKGKDTCIGGPGKDKYVGCEIKVETP